jgi:hypothetical protein
MLGMADDVEPGGNRVRRLDAGDVGRELRRLGFQDVRSHRYAMHYAPEVGLLARGLSRPRLSRPALGALAAVNRVAGRLGNKLVVQGTRHPGARLGSRQGGFAYEALARSRAVQA